MLKIFEGFNLPISGVYYHVSEPKLELFLDPKKARRHLKEHPNKNCEFAMVVAINFNIRDYINCHVLDIDFDEMGCLCIDDCSCELSMRYNVDFLFMEQIFGRSSSKWQRFYLQILDLYVEDFTEDLVKELSSFVPDNVVDRAIQRFLDEGTYAFIQKYSNARALDTELLNTITRLLRLNLDWIYDVQTRHFGGEEHQEDFKDIAVDGLIRKFGFYN